MSILNARYIMPTNGPDPRPHVEIVYADKVKYAGGAGDNGWDELQACLLYTSPSPRDGLLSRMPSSA